MMAYFKIFSTGKQQQWSQDGLAYTDEQHARFWPENALDVMGLVLSGLCLPRKCWRLLTVASKSLVISLLYMDTVKVNLSTSSFARNVMNAGA